jgi:exopolyphosphatase/guanosine-5'-triphosphate,3'-diphosphate pyrophosphatase
MRIGVIDIGTHTSRLALFDVAAPAGPLPAQFAEINFITRLGEGLSASGVLSESAMSRTLDALTVFRAECDAARADVVAAVGTAALRSAANSAEFIRRARDAGILVKAISGEEEGALSFAGVAVGFDSPPARLLVIDVGGGSTEFTFGARGEREAGVSLDIGAVSLKERHIASDPATPRERELIRRRVEAEVEAGVLPISYPESVCAGVAGCVTTLAMMDLGLDKYDAAKVHGHILTAEGARRQTDRLFALDIAGRRAVPGMEPLRADVIHAGAELVCAAMDALGVRAMRVSETDIRHGLALRELRRAGFYK